MDFVGVNYYRSWWIEQSALATVAGLGFTGGGQPTTSLDPSLETAHVNDLNWRVTQARSSRRCAASATTTRSRS